MVWLLYYDSFFYICHVFFLFMIVGFILLCEACNLKTDGLVFVLLSVYFVLILYNLAENLINEGHLTYANIIITVKLIMKSDIQ